MLKFQQSELVLRFYKLFTVINNLLLYTKYIAFIMYNGNKIYMFTRK